MKALTKFLYILGIALGVFGYWGCFTWAGSKRYDEMDAIIPGFALFIGVILLAIALIMTLILYIRYRKMKAN